MCFSFGALLAATRQATNPNTAPQYGGTIPYGTFPPLIFQKRMDPAGNPPYSSSSGNPPRRVVRLRIPSGARHILLTAPPPLPPQSNDGTTTAAINNHDEHNNEQNTDTVIYPQPHPSIQNLRRRRRARPGDPPPAMQQQQQQQQEAPSARRPEQLYPSRPVRVVIPPPPPPPQASQTAQAVTVPPLEVKPLPDTQQQLDTDVQQAALTHVPTCAICWEFITAHIHACPHNNCTAHFCATCVQKLSQRHKCPLCQQPADNNFDRQTALEEHLQATVAPVPCRYAACSQLVSLADLHQHEQTCPAQRVTCAYQAMGCPWQGPRRDVDAHWNDDCRFYPLRVFIEQQRHWQALLQAQAAALSQQVAARHQHALWLEHRLVQTEERWRRTSTRLEQVQAQQQQQQQQQSTSPTIGRRLRFQPRLIQLLRYGVTIWQRPACLQGRDDMLGLPMSGLFQTLPLGAVALCTALDMWYTCTFVLHTNSPWLSMALLLALPVVLPRSRQIPSAAVVHWLFWCIVLWWYRHTDQCISIWFSTTCTVLLGTNLLSPRANEEEDDDTTPDQRHIYTAAVSWITVVYGIPSTVGLLTVFVVGHFIIYLLGDSWNRLIWVTISLMTMFLEPWLKLPKDARALFGMFTVVTLLLSKASVWWGQRLRQPGRSSAWLARLMIMVIVICLSWSIADCLYTPLIFVWERYGGWGPLLVDVASEVQPANE